MAKIRIYELARDLNIKNKELLEKLRDMNIAAGSHMSSLDDEAVVRVKASFLGKKTDTVEVTRVKTTVIRRRKKPVQKEPVQASTISAPEDSDQNGPDQTGRPEKIKVTEKPSEKAPEEEKSATEKKESERLEKKAEVEETAERIIEEEKAVKKVDSKKVDKIKQPVELEKPVVSPVVSKETKPKKSKKKYKKEIPAKIIKMPKPSEKKAPEKKAPKVKDVQAKKPKTKTAIAPEKADKKIETEQKGSNKENKKWTKKKEEIGEKKTKDIKWTKKKISFRKKAVIEGKDLYSGKYKTRKKSKGGKTSVQKQKPVITIPKAIKRRIKIDDAIRLSDLAKRMGIKAGDMIKTLMNLGVMATVNQMIDFDTAVLVAAEFNYELEKASFEEKAVLTVEKDDSGKLVQRPPVVTVMGHVDHGKTSLLDAIRKTHVTSGEAGGITQHIGAYNVATDRGQIVFLDTPGHEAFTAMRARGASLTDIVVLVVAADDGAMPQTIEAINHSKAAEVPIIVAINKIDKPNAEPERVQRELAEAGLVPEDWGGDTIFINVSAKQNQGITDLLEMILLQAEVLELKANPEKHAKGHVVEARIDSGRGAVATVLVQEGTLHKGDPVVCGIYYGKVRAMLNDRGVYVETAGPSTPVEVIGLSGVPNAGDELIALSDDKAARQVSIHRIQKQRAEDLAKTSRLSLEGLFERMREGEANDLNLIIKADVHGSIEAIGDSLTKLSNDEVNINVIHSATGTITESDISLAAVSDAIIIGFNVRPSLKVQTFADEESVDMRFYNIIYNVIEDIRNAIVGMMSSTFEERILGRAEVREVFHVPKIGAIAGCHVSDGKIERGQLVRLLRDGVVRYDGKISSLRRFKDDVKEVQSGYECGIGIEKYNDIKLGDTIECYYLEEIKPELE